MRFSNTREKCVLTRTFFNHEAMCQSAVRPPAERILPQRFWSSDKLTGSQTRRVARYPEQLFWSSDKLTGSQTPHGVDQPLGLFWSSDKLTGSQTGGEGAERLVVFWSSDKLTGSQTTPRKTHPANSFGAVTN